MHPTRQHQQIMSAISASMLVSPDDASQLIYLGESYFVSVFNAEAYKRDLVCAIPYGDCSGRGGAHGIGNHDANIACNVGPFV